MSLSLFIKQLADIYRGKIMYLDTGFPSFLHSFFLNAHLHLNINNMLNNDITPAITVLMGIKH